MNLPKHGVIKIWTLKPAHAKAHLAASTAAMDDVVRYHRGVDANNQTKDFGAHGTGYSSQGSFQQGGAAGADYQTSSADSVGDCDSTGATGY
jgi:hypothetical protein